LKRFSAPSINRIVLSYVSWLPISCLVLAIALAQTSCASDPEPAPTLADTVAPAIPEVADVVESMRRNSPGEVPVSVPLAEPAVPEPMTAAVSPPSPETGSTDITVLSVAPAMDFDTVHLPEPVPPAPAVASVAKPAPAVPPAAKPVPAPIKPAPATIAAPKPAAVAPKPEGSEPEVPAPLQAIEPKPAIALPPTPASSARSVVAAAERPVAETRIETTKGERFELRFPGTGWVFLGDEDGKDGLRYETRRFEENQAVFALDPESVGEYLLRFQRQNPVDRATETSFVRVVVTEKPSAPASPKAAATASTATVPPAPASAAAPAPETAPSAPSAAQPAPASPVPAQPAQPAAAVSAAAGISDPAALIRLAKAELEAKRVQSAIEALDRYLSLYPYGNDEVFYLYGLACEQDTPFRNVKKAYEYYKRVRDEYPRSARWREASERVAYLERHYFGLR
jgi:hypothetical protein